MWNMLWIANVFMLLDDEVDETMGGMMRVGRKERRKTETKGGALKCLSEPNELNAEGGSGSRALFVIDDDDGVLNIKR